MVELICFFVEFPILFLISPSWLLRTWSQLCLLVEFHPTSSFSTNGPSEFPELCTNLWPCHQNWSIPICLDLGSPPFFLQVFNTLCLSHSPIPMGLKKPSKLQITPQIAQTLRRYSWINPCEPPQVTSYQAFWRFFPTKLPPGWRAPGRATTVQMWPPRRSPSSPHLENTGKNTPFTVR